MRPVLLSKSAYIENRTLLYSRERK